MSKRKFKNAGEHAAHYDDDHVGYIHIGTEFPTLREIRAAERQNSPRDGKPRDYSRDAFKGGFTAGYHNTVGSKEGWKPVASFASSRSNRAKPRDMRPEDFMDEEDLADMKAQQSVVRLTYGQSSLHDPLADDGSDAESSGIVGLMARHVSAEFNALALSSLMGRAIGDIIMSAMGWKSGHGLGPLNRAVNGPRSGLNSLDASRLPPKPATRLVYEQRARSKHGADYGKELSQFAVGDTGHIAGSTDGISFLPSLGNLFKHPSVNSKSISNSRTVAALPQKAESKKKKKKKKAEMLRLSFGDFDDEDDGFDYSDVDTMGVSGIARNTDCKSTNLERLASEIASSKSKAKRAIVASYDPMTARCHDNKKPLPKFMLARSSDGLGTFDYEGPVVPESFIGIHTPTKTPRWDVGSSADSSNATKRRQVFGDHAADSSNANLYVEAATAKAALSGYMPFAANPDKQLRYRSYLEKCAGGPIGETHSHSSISGKEVAEFARLAQTFRPNTTMLSRFISAEESAAAAAEANRDSGCDDASSRVITNKHVTRTARAWAPSQLLCKRLHVQAPANAIANRPKPKQASDSQSQEIARPHRRQRAADFIEWNSVGQGGAVGEANADSLIIPADDPVSTGNVGMSDGFLAVKSDPNLLLSVFGDSDSE